MYGNMMQMETCITDGKRKQGGDNVNKGVRVSSQSMDSTISSFRLEASSASRISLKL